MREILNSTVYNPDRWIIFKLTTAGEGKPPLYKLLCGWNGICGWNGRGYFNRDYWRINSGITRVEETDFHYKFYGYSGSCYICPKRTETYQFNGVMSDTFHKIENEVEKLNWELEILPYSDNFVKELVIANDEQ